MKKWLIEPKKAFKTKWKGRILLKQRAKVVGIVMALFLLFMVTSSVWADQNPESAMAKVNGSYIMAQDFQLLMNRYIDHYKSSYGVDLESEEMGMQLAQLQDMVLQQLIVNELILQSAAEREIEVTEEDINEQVEEILLIYPDEESFMMVLEQLGYTLETFKVDLRVQLVTERFMESLLDRESIADEEIEEHFQNNQHLFGGDEEQVHASHILVETEEEALEILGYLEEQTFQELAATYSQCPSGASGGDLGFFGRGQMVLPFEEAAFNLAEEEISDPVETDFGWHIITVHERQEAVVYTFEEVKDQVYNHFAEETKQRKTNEYLEKAFEEANIEYFDMDM